MKTTLIHTHRTQIEADETAEAREDLAARLERLASQVRTGHGHTRGELHIIESAYGEVVKLTYRLQPLLGKQTT